MHEELGNTLSEFDAALKEFREALAGEVDLCDAVFRDTDEWLNLLSHKLVPHFAGQGCLVAAVTGGTNTGKSTVFNLLVGSEVSAIAATAAATRHPVIAASPMRAEQCLNALLIPEFAPVSLGQSTDAIQEGLPADLLFVAQVETLNDQLVVLDTPDVDSVEKKNWEVADNIRAAGDVLIAVLTAEKYKDDRVVSFFKQALESGRLIVPIMNKANPDNDYDVAKRQLAEFSEDVGQSLTAFVLPHDFALGDTHFTAIRSLNGGMELRQYLDTLDVPALKQRVYKSSLAYFSQRTEVFLEHTDEVAGVLRQVVDEFEDRAWSYATQYEPEPGSEVGGLFHEFIQSKRGPIRRVIGSASSRILDGAKSLARTVRTGLLKSATLSTDGTPPTDENITQKHRQELESLARKLITSYIDSARNVREPAAGLLARGLDNLNVEETVARIVVQTLQTESISEAFRLHAHATLERWWSDHAGKRRILEALDTLLAAVPTAIAAPLSVYTGGFGVPEAVVVVGPLAEQFVARVIEYQFADAMFDFLSPWQLEQQDAFCKALKDNVTKLILGELTQSLQPFDGEIMTTLRRCHEICQKAS